jgi:hypothetical protein
LCSHKDKLTAGKGKLKMLHHLSISQMVNLTAGKGNIILCNYLPGIRYTEISPILRQMSHVSMHY